MSRQESGFERQETKPIEEPHVRTNEELVQLWEDKFGNSGYQREEPWGIPIQPATPMSDGEIEVLNYLLMRRKDRERQANMENDGSGI